MKKTLKKLAIIISTLMLILLIQAILGVKGVMATIPNKDGTFIETSLPVINKEITPDTGLNSMTKKVIGVVQYVSAGAALIVILVYGVKFMQAAPDEKAKIKEQAIALVIGASIVFAISSIVQIVANITAKLV